MSAASNVMPGCGDAYRVYRTLPQDRYRSRAVAAVAIERAVGLLALLVLGSAGAFLLFDEFAVARFYFVALLVAAAIGATVLVAFKRGWLHGAIRRWRHISAVDAVLHSIDPSAVLARQSGLIMVSNVLALL